MAKRYHAMLFPVGPEIDEVEAVRRAWDPIMAARIPAHITLVYPDEHPGVDALAERLKAVATHRRAFRIRLGSFRAFPPPDDGCVYLEVGDLDRGFAELRKAAAAPPFGGIEFPPHLTVIHPRTSDRASEFWRASCPQNVRQPLLVDAISIVSSENETCAVEERFPMLSP